MLGDEQGKRTPTRITKWDIFALLSETAKDFHIVTANFFSMLTQMLDTYASFVDEKESFHEYAARTIETLTKEGE